MNATALRHATARAAFKHHGQCRGIVGLRDGLRARCLKLAGHKGACR